MLICVLTQVIRLKLNRALAEVDAMNKAVLADGWDGEWFVRAYDAQRSKVGSKECEEGQIFIEPQGFCVLAGSRRREGKLQSEHWIP